MKRLTAFLLVLALLPLLPLAAQAQRTVIYAYFQDARWLRDQPAAGSGTVENVPARTLLRLEPVDDKYAATSYKGKPGYIYYKEYVPVDYKDPLAPDAVRLEGFFGAPVYMRQSPLRNAPLVAELPTDVRFQITPVTDEYAYIVYEGKEGYVYIADFVEMQYRKGSTDPYVAYVDEVTPAYSTPYYGAVVGAELQPSTPVTVDGYDGDHVTIVYNGLRLYADGAELTRLSEDYTLEPFGATMNAKTDMLEYPLEHAAVLGEVAKDAQVTVLSLHGEYARVWDGVNTAGYVPFKRLKSSAQVDAAVDMLGVLQDQMEARRILNIAFSMLEENNPILLAYNRDFGGSAVARFQYGCPYLWAGFSESSLLRARHPSSSSNYYFVEQLYLGGFDCIGYTRWVHSQAGMKKLPAISDTQSASKANKVDVKGLPYDQWPDALKVGDAINLHYKGGGYHTGLYIGTLRDFGFDESEVGALAPYVDYPLMIHCGMNNFHTAWYTQYLSDNRLTSVTPPDGGVTISILGVPYADCPSTETMWQGTRNQKTFWWFDLAGYNLTVITPTDESYSWFNVYRNTLK